MWEGWLRVARDPIFATAANVLGVGAGLLGALYATEIRSASFHWKPADPIDWPAVIFWLSFVVFAFTFLSREWAVQNIEAESEKRLQDMIRTMPPRGFVVDFADYYDKCAAAVDALGKIHKQATREQISAVIRLLLRNIATLAQRYDARGGDQYSANLMLVWESKAAYEAANATRPALDVRFVEPEVNVAALRLLVLDETLSASTAEAEPLNPDGGLSSLKGFALPIPADSSSRSPDGRRWRVLPGAPLAFVEQELNAYDDTVRLGDWFERHGDFTQSTRQAVEGYFGSEQTRRSIRSFACLPLTTSNGLKLGVLNLHSNRPNILSAPGTPSQFYPLIRPLIATLADLVQRLLKTAG